MERFIAWWYAPPTSVVAALALICGGTLLTGVWVLLAMHLLARRAKSHLEQLSAEAAEAHEEWVEHIRSTELFDELVLIVREEAVHRLLQLGVPQAVYVVCCTFVFGRVPYALAVAMLLLAYSTARFARAHASPAVPWWQYCSVQGTLGLTCGVLYLKFGGISGSMLAGFAAAVAAHLLWNRVIAQFVMWAVDKTLEWRGLA